MMKAVRTATVYAIFLSAGAALAAPTPQQRCDYLRITVWKRYVSCMESLLAKNAKGTAPSAYNDYAPFARCRHTYFRKWTGFQTNAGLAGSTCIGARFTDNGDQTVTDHLTGLVWEKKTSRDDTQNYLDPHDADNGYSWGFGGIENGSTFIGFLRHLNEAGGFAGANGWRLPTLVELQTILLDFVCKGEALGPQCTCPSNPCVDPALDAANTWPAEHWSATSEVGDSSYAWRVHFNSGIMFPDQKTLGAAVRAVRSGL